MAYMNGSKIANINLKVLTEQDKYEIGEMLNQTDQTYNPESIHAQSGKAVAEALKPFSGTYKHIETIVTTEGVQTISLSKEPNGNAYNFKDVFVKFVWNTDIMNKWVLLEITAGGTNVSTFADTAYSNTADAKSWVRTLSCYGHRLFLFSGVTTNLGYAHFPSELPLLYDETNKPINAIKIQFREPFPIGTTIEIWGVRA